MNCSGVYVLTLLLAFTAAVNAGLEADITDLTDAMDTVDGYADLTGTPKDEFDKFKDAVQGFADLKQMKSVATQASVVGAKEEETKIASAETYLNNAQEAPLAEIEAAKELLVAIKGDLGQGVVTSESDLRDIKNILIESGSESDQSDRLSKIVDLLLKAREVEEAEKASFVAGNTDVDDKRAELVDLKTEMGKMNVMPFDANIDVVVQRFLFLKKAKSDVKKAESDVKGKIALAKTALNPGAGVPTTAASAANAVKTAALLVLEDEENNLLKWDSDNAFAVEAAASKSGLLAIDATLSATTGPLKDIVGQAVTVAMKVRKKDVSDTQVIASLMSGTGASNTSEKIDIAMPSNVVQVNKKKSGSVLDLASIAVGAGGVGFLALVALVSFAAGAKSSKRVAQGAAPVNPIVVDLQV